MPAQILSSNQQSSPVQARILLAIVLLAELCHILAVCLLPHPFLPSNLFQLLLPILGVITCLHRRTGADRLGQRCWAAIAFAFGIWAMGQVLYLLFIPFPVISIAHVRLDDVLWVLYGLPVLLAINVREDGLDQVQWLDRIQTFLFFLSLYLVVFLCFGGSKISPVYFIQNVALVLCCLLRLPTCRRAWERRFFLHLTTYLSLYGALEKLSDHLYARGWPAGSPVDLCWTLPIASFLVLTLWQPLHPSAEDHHAERYVHVATHTEGLSVTALAVLSVSVSLLLAKQRPIEGDMVAALCFLLFALRTNAREHAWHQVRHRLEQMTLEDSLTGVGNRALLRASLKSLFSGAFRQSPPVVLFIDLDRFKSINDTLGHAIGDNLLVQFAGRLQASAPAGSTICRMGGDEFVVLIASLTASEARITAEQILDALSRPYQIEEQTIRCTASIGAVFASPSQTADEFLRTADLAMYRAKQLGRGRVQVFDAVLLNDVRKRSELEADLKIYIQGRNIQVAFQPILHNGTGEIAGFEALARWHHPKYGQVSPADFIPIAEEAGLICAFGAEVLEIACLQVARWNRARNTQYSVNVNVSPRQLADTSFLDIIFNTLERTELDPSLLRLELTESALLAHQGTASFILEEARKLGILIALDDFGTGYSSLSFLLSLPVDEIKIDRSFVSGMIDDPQRTKLVRTIIDLGQSLGKSIVAEGVETSEELNALVAMGCEYAQGWYIGKPLLARAAEQNLDRRGTRSLITTPAPHTALPAGVPNPPMLPLQPVSGSGLAS